MQLACNHAIATKDSTPDVVISVAETGTIAVGGTDCGLSSGAAMTAGTNTVTLTTSGDKAYTCTITFTDSADEHSRCADAD